MFRDAALLNTRTKRAPSEKVILVELVVCTSAELLKLDARSFNKFKRRTDESSSKIKFDFAKFCASDQKGFAVCGAAGRHCLFLSVCGVEHRAVNMNDERLRSNLFLLAPPLFLSLGETQRKRAPCGRLTPGSDASLFVLRLRPRRPRVSSRPRDSTPG